MNFIELKGYKINLDNVHYINIWEHKPYGHSVYDVEIHFGLAYESSLNQKASITFTFNEEYELKKFEEKLDKALKINKSNGVFTYAFDNYEDFSIIRDKVVCYSKTIMNEKSSTPGKVYYEVVLENNIKTYLPNEEVYQEFCKWIKEE